MTIAYVNADYMRTLRRCAGYHFFRCVDLGPDSGLIITWRD